VMKITAVRGITNPVMLVKATVVSKVTV
jgi:hypothetical protein